MARTGEAELRILKGGAVGAEEDLLGEYRRILRQLAVWIAEKSLVVHRVHVHLGFFLARGEVPLFEHLLHGPNLGFLGVDD